MIAVLSWRILQDSAPSFVRKFDTLTMMKSDSELHSELLHAEAQMSLTQLLVSDMKRGGLRVSPGQPAWAPAALAWLIVALFFYGFAGQGFRNMLGDIGSGVLMTIVFILMLVVLHLLDLRISWRNTPPFIGIFVTWCALSTLWSQYPGSTFVSAVVSICVTIVGIAIASVLDLRGLIRSFTVSMQAILVASVALELFVSLVFRQMLPPLPMLTSESVPRLYYWVDGTLFKGGPIQGFMGNRNPLAFVALLSLVSLGVEYTAKLRSLTSTCLWSAGCLAIFALTRSATVILAFIGCAFVAAVLVGYRKISVRFRPHFAVGTFIFTAVSAAVLASNHRLLTDALGKSSDMTGRGEIWRTLYPLWQEHPILGWGWVIGWPKNNPIFAHLIPREDGTPTTQAHNAIIEATFQTGIIGMILLSIALLVLVWQVLKISLTHIDDSPIYSWPLVVMAAFLIQSLAESRLLFEGNWMLVVAIATWSHRYLTGNNSRENDMTALMPSR